MLLLLLLAAAPLPWGSVLPGGALRIELLSYAALAVAVGVSPQRRLGPAWLPLLFAGVLALLGTFQLAPLPEGMIATASPVSARIYHETNRILGMYDAAPATPRISIAPAETLSVVLLTLAFAAAFAAAALSFGTGRYRRWFGWAVPVVGFVHIVLAMAFAGSNTALGRVHGAFVNPNNFAGYLEIALFVCFGLVWTEIATGRERIRHSPDLAVRLERRLVRLIPSMLLLFAIAGGLVLTQSRGGIAAASFVLVVGVVLSLVHPAALRRRTQHALGAVFTVAGIVAFIAISTGFRPLLRFLAADPRDPMADLRPQIWTYSVEAWRQFPVFGSGLGTFREAFRRVQPRDMQGLVEQAHSEPMQMLVTGGWVGLAITTLLVLSLLVVLAHGWWKQKHREEAAFALAGFLALLSLLVHGLVEFNFSIPAIPATLAMVAGWSFAASMRPER